MTYLALLKKLYLGEISKPMVFLEICSDHPKLTVSEKRQIKLALLGCMNGISPIDVDIRLREILDEKTGKKTRKS